MKRIAKCCIAPDQAGQTILAFLSHRFTYHTTGRWQELLDENRVLRNNEPVGPDEILHAGDVVEYVGFAQTEPTVQTAYEVVYEDAYLLAINKPGNLPCHPGGRYFNNTLWSLLKAQHAAPYLGFVNRIDRETSGIVLVAKSPSVTAACRQQFERHKIDKKYIAGVEGVFPAKGIYSSGYLIADVGSPVRKKRRFVTADSMPVEISGAQSCKTSFLRCAHRGDLSLVHAKPMTGRTHQIRATLCSMGFPVVGDKLYGVDDTLFLRFIEDRLDETDRRRLRIDRQALHAAALLMIHPHTGRPIHFKAPLPLDMASLVNGE